MTDTTLCASYRRLPEARLVLCSAYLPQDWMVEPEEIERIIGDSMDVAEQHAPRASAQQPPPSAAQGAQASAFALSWRWPTRLGLNYYGFSWRAMLVAVWL